VRAILAGGEKTGWNLRNRIIPAEFEGMPVWQAGKMVRTDARKSVFFAPDRQEWRRCLVLSS
jgi:hypothetical protein